MNTTTRERRQTRRKVRPIIDTSIPSPCKSLCQIDKTNSTCIGCRRTLDEIRNWMIMTAEEKQSVWQRLNSISTDA
ncbi:MAG: DUF1289 domain-containing protein [Alphaproteobacteria bacterium]